MKKLVVVFQIFFIAAALVTISCSGPTSQESNAQLKSNDIDFRIDTLPAAEMQKARLSDGYQIQLSNTPGYSGIAKLFIRGNNLHDFGVGNFDKDAIASAARTMLIANNNVLKLAGKVKVKGVYLTDTSAHFVGQQVGKLINGEEIDVFSSGISLQINANGDFGIITKTMADNVDGLAPATLNIDEAKKVVLNSLKLITLNMKRNGITKSELVDFSPTSAELTGPIIYIKKDGTPIVGYFATVTGLVGDKKNIQAAVLNGWTGAIEDDFPTSVGVNFTARGNISAYHYDTYPQTLTAPVFHLDNSIFELEGQYVAAHNEVMGDPADPNRYFDFFAYPPTDPITLQRSVAEAYFAGDGYITFIRRLGFQSLFHGPPLYVDALDIDAFDTAYSFAQQQVWLNSGASFNIVHADDQTVIAHEIDHYLHHLTGILIGLLTPYQYPYQNPSGNGNAAMDEGFADFHSSITRYGTPNFGKIYAADTQGGNPPFLRYLRKDLNVIDNWAFDYYDQSQIWSSTLVKLGETIGNSLVTRLGLESVKCIHTTDGFNEGEKCIEWADENLYGGKHKDIIQQTFAKANIYGLDDFGNVRPPPNFPSDFIQSAHPYADAGDPERILRVNNATAFGGLRFTLDGDVNTNDVLEVRNGAGTLVASLTKGNVDNRVITVRHSDIARLRVVSTPGDNQKAEGYNVVAADFINLEGFIPNFTATASETSGTAPLPVLFKVTSNNAIAVKIDTGIGTKGYLAKDANGEWEFEQVYDYDPATGPQVNTQTYNAVITVVSRENQVATRTIPIEVKPYRQKLGPRTATSPTTGGSATGVGVGSMTCTLTPTGYTCI